MSEPGNTKPSQRFDLMMRGFSAWCAGRQGVEHEKCSTAGCPCDCHRPSGSSPDAKQP